MNILKPICAKHWLPPEGHEFLASVDYKNEKITFENCYKNEKSLNLQLLQFIDKLMAKIGHEGENKSNRNQHKKPYNIFEYHAEKIAAAFLLNKDENIKEILIDVNLRMCNDCHLFFEKLTEYYPLKTIKITDPKMTHTFTNGSCSCGKSRYV